MQNKCENEFINSDGFTENSVGSGIGCTNEQLGIEEQIKIVGDIKKLLRRKTLLKLLLFSFVGLVGGGFLLPIIAMVAVIASFVQKLNVYDPKTLPKDKNTIINFSIAYGIIGIIMISGAIVVQILQYHSAAISLPLWAVGIIFGAIWFLVMFYVLGFVLAVTTVPIVKRLELDFYKKNNPIYLYDKPVIEASGLYVTYQKVVHGLINAKKPAVDILHILYPVAIVLIALIVGFVSYSHSIDYIFKTRQAEKIELGASSSEVQSLIGSPIADDWTSYNKIQEYCSENCKKLLSRLDKLGEEFNDNPTEECLEKIFKIEEQLSTLTYQYIRVTYGSAYGYENSYGSAYDVSDVVVDTHKSGKNELVKSANYVVEKVEVSQNYNSEINSRYSAKVWFKNGSYHNSYIEPEITRNTDGSLSLQWTDSYFGVSVKSMFFGQQF